ncbi:MAG TPA: hypothetical protein DDX39_08800 [Bacteroidales bacterium]|nr:MAG: hypothetical protein A2W98_11920 [Bacteroidetes bacterium GWF2_33_38]OFY91989.1 MAG: hypothetical protein A2236_12050 [Bacteroidetes bacterium RIFOXYA2_FULL_33_7]HBF88725.1 hypothetical protein [Bacteroidales bacterium]
MDSEKKNIDIQKFLESVPDNYSIIDQQIDVSTQIEYFELARKVENKSKSQDVFNEVVKLYDDRISLNDKKIILINLAAIGDVDSFRTIESFNKSVSNELKDWAALALQESKVLLENSLLDEQRVIISTGLGGKENLLRYFVVLIKIDESEFEDYQKKIISDELDFVIEQKKGQLEEISFEENFCKGVLLLPLKLELKDFFQKLIRECNQYGGFLKPNFLLTNVKALTNSEIKNFILKST